MILHHETGLSCSILFAFMYIASILYTLLIKNMDNQINFWNLNRCCIRNFNAILTYTTKSRGLTCNHSSRKERLMNIFIFFHLLIFFGLLGQTQLYAIVNVARSRHSVQRTQNCGKIVCSWWVGKNYHSYKFWNLGVCNHGHFIDNTTSLMQCDWFNCIHVVPLRFSIF